MAREDEEKRGSFKPEKSMQATYNSGSIKNLGIFGDIGCSCGHGPSKQTSELAGYPLEASYNLSSALKFSVVGNAVVCGYTLLSLLLVSKILKGWLLRFLDLMVLGLVMAAASAATTIGYLGQKVNIDIGWTEVCSYYEKFCDRVGISIAFSYVGFLLFLLICVLSSTQKA